MMNYLVKGWLKKLSGNEAEQEQVVEYIFRPKSANRINQAKAYFGSEGAAGNTTDGFNVGGFNKVREAAMMKNTTRCRNRRIGNWSNI